MRAVSPVMSSGLGLHHLVALRGLPLATLLLLALGTGTAWAQEVGPPPEAVIEPEPPPPVPPPTVPPPADEEATTIIIEDSTGEDARMEAGAIEDGGASRIEIHGFVSQGLIKTTHNNYLAESDRGSFEMAEAGINVTKALGDRLRLGVQLFARDLGPIGDYSAKFDWFYLDYQLTEWLGLRAGRVKLPVGLYNEFSDVDAARVPILLPQSIYSVRSRDYLLAQTGFELYGYRPLPGAGALDYRLYLGTIFLDAPATISSQARNIDIPYVAGGRLLWETPLEGLRTGGSLQILRLDFDYTSPDSPGPPPVPGVLGHYKAPVLIWVASAEYAVRDLLLAAEYSRWRVKITADVPVTVPTPITSERFYVMAAYRLTPRLSPSVYYSALYSNVDDRDGRDAYQHDLAATLRFDLTANLMAKVEGHLMNGTGDLQSNLNDGRPRLELTETWGLFLLKLTAFF
jgi:hypothetical protein